MSNIALLIFCITVFPILVIVAFLVSITTFIRAQKAQLHISRRLRSLEEELVVLVTELENITRISEVDRRTVRTLGAQLEDTRTTTVRRENPNASVVGNGDMTASRLNHHSRFQRHGLSASRATTQSRRTGGTSRNVSPRRHVSAPRTVDAPFRATSRTSSSTYSPAPRPHITYSLPPQPLLTRPVNTLLNILLYDEPTLSTQQIQTIILLFNDAVARYEHENTEDSTRDPFTDPSYPSNSSTPMNPPPTFHASYLPLSSSTSLSGNTLVDSFSGTTLVSSSSSDSDDATHSLGMRTIRPRSYSRYSRYEELMLQRSNRILTPAQLAQVEAMEGELRVAIDTADWEDVGFGEEDADENEEDLGA